MRIFKQKRKQPRDIEIKSALSDIFSSNEYNISNGTTPNGAMSLYRTSSAVSVPVDYIADVVKTKSIGIFGPTSPDRNGSLNPSSTVIYKKFSCSPCHKKKCDDVKCINQINEEDILMSIKSINE